MFTKICDAEDAACYIEAMRTQEVTGYFKSNYLTNTTACHDQDQAQPSARSNGPLNCEDPDEECRFRMTEWCFQVVDFCKYQRETVEIVMSYFDRFLGTPEGAATLKDRKMFQLAAMTCLYTAIKTHEPEAMEPQVISGLSRGVYSADDIEAMERQILAAIQWRLNPPTALSFIRLFAALVPDGIWAEDDLEAIVALAKYQTELAVGEYSFVGVNSSTIAFAALSNALQVIDDVKLRNDLMKKVSSTANINVDSQELVTTRKRLWTAMDKKSDDPQRYLMPQSPTVQKATQRSSAVYESPRGVISTR
jgi:Cyclin, N-terminal domain/Cyclin, C-terminal domain